MIISVLCLAMGCHVASRRLHSISNRVMQILDVAVECKFHGFCCITLGCPWSKYGLASDHVGEVSIDRRVHDLVGEIIIDLLQMVSDTVSLAGSSFVCDRRRSNSNQKSV